MAFRYQGGFIGPERSGTGKYLYPGASFSYDGEFSRGVKHGHGEFRLPDGSVYVGEFVQGEIQGQGERVWPDGSRYVGEWYAGERNGEGTFEYADGSKYIGSFARNQREGRGVLITATGSEYAGEFERNRYHGTGRLSHASGSVYEGCFHDGRRQGQGRYDCAITGMVYEGEWEADAPKHVARALTVESPVLAQQAAEAQAAAAAAAPPPSTKGAKPVPKKEDPKAKQQPAQAAEPLPPPLPQLHAGASLPQLVFKASPTELPWSGKVAGPSPSPATAAAFESHRQLRVVLVRTGGPDGSLLQLDCPLPFFQQLPSAEAVSSWGPRFPRDGCRSLFALDRDVLAPPPEARAAQPEEKGDSAADGSTPGLPSLLLLKGDAQLGQRGGRPCVCVSGAEACVHVPTGDAPVQWSSEGGVSVAMDFWLDRQAVVDKAAAGPVGSDGRVTVPLLRLGSSGVALVVSTRLREPDEDGQRPEASLALLAGGGPSAESVELRRDVGLDAWHALVLTLRASELSMCLDSFAFEASLPTTPVPSSEPAVGGGEPWVIGGDGFSGAVANVALYLDGRSLELSTAFEASACYERLREQEARLTEEDAQRKQAWEEAGREGAGPEAVPRAAMVTCLELSTVQGQASVEDLVLPPQLAPGSYAICAQDRTPSTLAPAAAAATAGGPQAASVFKAPLPTGALHFMVVPRTDAPPA